MCGIAGAWDLRASLSSDALRETGHAMAQELARRGPDGEGIWTEPVAGVVFAHRRLSIIDLSHAADQPMLSACGRYAITFNGEIYNYVEIRKELEALGVQFKSHSDTEALVEGCARWGVPATLAKCVGMFAFGLWDREFRKLTLVRDRLGVKPLYWARLGQKLVFASQSKAFRVLPEWREELDTSSVQNFLMQGYVRAPHSIYRGVQQVMPGTMLEFSPDSREPAETRFWDLETGVASRAQGLRDISETQGTNLLDELLTDAVRLRLIADVPVGAFLSGGVDSSLVVALMQKVSRSPVKTFTVGFREAQFDESQHAAAVARHVGTEHTQLDVSYKEALEIVPTIPEAYDEPFADSSQIPTMLISRLIRKHVTVALSGDGGDELFAGYNRYLWNRSLSNLFRRVPYFVRNAGASAIHAVSPPHWDQIFGGLSKVSRRFGVPAPGDKLHKLANILKLRRPDQIYGHLVSQWASPPYRNGTQATLVPGPLSVREMQLADLQDYLPNDILTKVDRASMAFSLEAREPLLDHRLAELAFALPLEWKLQGNETKRILRRVLYRYVPREMIERPKMGFGIPLADWLRGPLRDWAEELLSEKRLAEAEYLDAALIRQKWAEHQSGSRNWQYALWNVIMFQAWRGRA